MKLQKIQIILFVADQDKSHDFYRKLFRKEAELHVPGMTEFSLNENCTLGLMPSQGIVKILENKIPHPEKANGIPRCELYLHVDDLETEYNNALNCGATLVSPVSERNWGDRACYFSDPDGHLIAFAQTMAK